MQQLLFEKKEEEIFSLHNYIKTLKENFEVFLWFKSDLIECEVEKITMVRWFYYLDLIETGDFWKIKAKIRWNIFNKITIDAFLKRVKIWNYREMEWMKIVIKARPSFHEFYGISLIIEKIMWDFTAWQMQWEKEDIIKRLKERWVLDKNKNLTLAYPKLKIAIISNSESAWLEDFLKIIEDSKINLDYKLFESLVWWENAIDSVLSAIKKIREAKEKFDLILIVRWWWDSEWMHWANDEKLALEVGKLDIPLMSAIWHTSDVSILDMIAKFDCKTPSESAKVLIDYYKKFEEETDFTYKNIKNKLNLIKLEIKNKLISFKNIKIKISNKIEKEKLTIENIKNNIDIKLKNNVLLYKKELLNTYNSIKSKDYNKILKKGYFIIKNDDKVLKNPKVWEKYILESYEKKFEIEIKKDLN